MSTTKTESYEETQCHHCQTTYRRGYNEDYCSETCKDAHTAARELLSKLKYDHRFCASCGTQLKNVRDAKPSDPDCFIGYQFLTGDTMKGEKHVTLPGTQQHDSRLIDSHGTICSQCGATNHKDTYIRQQGLLDDDLSTVAERIFEALALFRREGKHSKQFDLKAFVEAWNDSPGNWTRALGASIQGGKNGD